MTNNLNAKITALLVIFAFPLVPQISRVAAQQAPVNASPDASAKAASTTSPAQQGAASHPRENTLIKRTWGIELLGVQLISADYMLEFRYKVIDAKKAKPIFERKSQPLLTDQATGVRFQVPNMAKVGALRNSDPPIAGKVYWMFFGNPGKIVKPGSRVNIEIGEFHVNGLVVQ
jgi:hypothetical protein